MQIISFRIRSFRSIVDTTWTRFSPDGITAFVGQNESGKSTILQALHFALSDANPVEDDMRIESEPPTVEFRVKLEFSEIRERLKESATAHIAAAEQYLLSNDGVVEIRVGWEGGRVGGRWLYAKKINLISQEFDQQLDPLATWENLATAVSEAIQSADPNVKKQRQEGKLRTPIKMTSMTFARVIWDELPLGVLFREDDGQLPSHIDIDKEGTPTGFGTTAASHFLRIAKINLPDLLVKDRRTREALLKNASERVTEDLSNFWSQTIGKSGRIAIKVEVDHYNQSTPDKLGQPHLVFWIFDGKHQLYPSQRSQGVRWFISFYLQLKSSEMDGLDRMFLLDEPGANLHSRAQADVLKLLNKLASSNSAVVYTTHSPELLEYSKLYRVHAVQRSGDENDSPTTIIDAHRLGTASTDTLTPVISAMGADLSQQQVIQKLNNVLLEEMSGYYYLSAFWKLTEQSKAAYFIAATGVNKIEILANMFRGWGLQFIVAIDDDKQGRDAYQSMKRNLFGDDSALSSKGLLTLPNCSAIEDAFSVKDFARFVLEDATISFDTTPGEYLKTVRRSKPVLSFTFSNKVIRGEIKFSDFDEKTRDLINNITTAIASRLS
jgi:energy-coupling factor transporter ATP-binding protein EcfA2